HWCARTPPGLKACDGTARLATAARDTVPAVQSSGYLFEPRMQGGSAVATECGRPRDRGHRSKSGIMNANIVHVQRLTEALRPGLERHFLSLEPEDVRLRFGANIATAAI